MAGDPNVVVIPCFYPDKVCSPPDFRDVLSQMICLWGRKHGGNSESVGMMGVMAISFNVGWETTVGAVRVHPQEHPIATHCSLPELS